MKLATAFALLILFSVQVGASEKQAHSFMTFEKFVQMPEPARQFYVAGLADAFTYLEARTGWMAGLSECLRQNRVTPRLAEQLVNEFLGANSPSREHTLAEAFEIGNRAACHPYITDELQKRALE